MKKVWWIIAIIVFLTVLAIVEISLFTDSEKILGNKLCINAGGHIALPSEANRNLGCCEGLRTIPPTFPSTDPKDHISSLPEGCGISVGPTPICSNCGNGKCEPWENKCNCPEDCS